MIRWLPVWILPLLLSTGTAFGQSREAVETPPDAETTDAESEPHISREDLPSFGLQRLADRLTARERALERRERDLAQREQDLRIAEQRIETRLEELQQLRKDLEQAVGQVDEEEEDRLIGVVKMFEAMRGKEAAPIMTAMSPEEAVQVLDRMNRTKAGKLLAALPPVLAADLASRMTQPIVLEER